MRALSTLVPRSGPAPGDGRPGRGWAPLSFAENSGASHPGPDPLDGLGRQARMPDFFLCGCARRLSFSNSSCSAPRRPSCTIPQRPFGCSPQHADAHVASREPTGFLLHRGLDGLFAGLLVQRASTCQVQTLATLYMRVVLTYIRLSFRRPSYRRSVFSSCNAFDGALWRRAVTSRRPPCTCFRRPLCERS